MRVASMAVVLAAAAGLAAPALAQVNPEIAREGTGARRDALNKMELAPFPAEIWGKLSEWSPAPITSAETSGQVVVICTYASWYEPSMKAINGARRLAEKYAKDGVIVIAVHHEKGWDPSKKPTAPQGAKFFVAHDAKNEFRAALSSDQDPDAYIIDRAGQLRFADITNESVEPAVTMLIAETAESAAGVKAKLADAKEEALKQAAKAQGIRQQIDLSSIPPVPPGYVDPTPEAYAAVSWPKRELKEGQQEEKAPPAIQLPDAGWLGEKPATKGRAVVLYFWNFSNRASYSQMTQLDQLQHSRGRDVAVIGVFTPLGERNSNETQEIEKDPVKLQKQLTDFARTRTLDHAILVEPSGALLNATGGESAERQFPFAAILSSDGTVRFVGPMSKPSFRSTLDNLMTIDPGIKARRAADDAYLKAQGG